MKQHTLRTLDAFEQSATQGSFFPVYFGIEVTRHCNYACIMCPHSKIPETQKGHMSIELFKKIVDEISPYAEIIKLHWLGEPLLHPQITELLQYARNKTSAQLHLSTNASLLEGKLSEAIRDSGLDKIIFSLDGMSTKTYENIRVNGVFDQVLNNIENFIESVDKKGGPLCHVKMIQFKQNEHEMAHFKEKWKQFKNVMIDVMWLSDWAGLISSVNSLSNYHNPISTTARKPCSDLWFKMQIDWSGKVPLCCFDAMSSVELGDISKRSVFEIWNNPSVIKFREKHISNHTSGICKDCTDWASPDEYEFWYTIEELIEDPQRIWKRR